MPTGVYKRKPFSEEHRKKISLALSGKIGKKHSLETKKKMSISAHRGENHHAWKGDKATYSSIHVWMEINYGKPSTCEHCQRKNLKGKFINWANISGKYIRERKDWIRLCTRCHHKFDSIYTKGWITRRRKLCTGTFENL